MAKRTKRNKAQHNGQKRSQNPLKKGLAAYQTHLSWAWLRARPKCL